MISFRIIGGERFLKARLGRRIGSQHLEIESERDRPAMIEIYPTCLLPALVIKNHDVTFIYTLQFHIFVGLDIGGNTTISTALLNILFAVPHLLAKGHYYHSTLQMNTLRQGVGSCLVKKVSLYFLLMWQIYIMIYYPAVSAQPKILVYRLFFFRYF